MEQGAIRSVTEPSQIEMTMKTEVEAAVAHPTHVDVKIDLVNMKQMPGSVQLVNSGPKLSVKQEILEDTSQDGSKQQRVQGESVQASTGRANEACSSSVGDFVIVKQEPVDMDVGPTVLQHMDIKYPTNKQNASVATGEDTKMNDYYDPMPDSGVKRDSIKCKLRGPITHQKATKMEQNVCCTLQSHQKTHNKEDLVSTCRVHLMRLDAFQCELCEAVYAEKHRLLQHLESVHRSRPQNSSFVKFRKTNRRQHAADNDTIPPLITSRKYHGKKMTEKDYTMPMKSYQGQQQQHLVCRPWAMSSNSFKCDVCGRAFLMQHLLRAHMKLHQQKGSKTSVVTSGLVAGPSNQSRNATAKMGPYRRKSLHPDIGLLVGNVCDAKFSTKRVLKNNFGTHTNKPYKCSECDAKFASMGSLTLHMRVHTGEKPYQCGTCGARFTQCGALTMHVRFHTGERPYQCDACDAKFVQKCDLIQHRRVHTGEKPYRCDTCNARFARSNHLNLHMRIHTGEKPYNCNMCDERFSSSIKVTAHMRIHLGKTGKRAYTGKKPYQCDTCEAQFARRNNLTVHKKIHTR